MECIWLKLPRCSRKRTRGVLLGSLCLQDIHRDSSGIVMCRFCALVLNWFVALSLWMRHFNIILTLAQRTIGFSSSLCSGLCTVTSCLLLLMMFNWPSNLLARPNLESLRKMELNFHRTFGTCNTNLKNKTRLFFMLKPRLQIVEQENESFVESSLGRVHEISCWLSRRFWALYF